MTFSTERSRTPRLIRGSDGAWRDNPEWMREWFEARFGPAAKPPMHPSITHAIVERVRRKHAGGEAEPEEPVEALESALLSLADRLANEGKGS